MIRRIIFQNIVLTVTGKRQTGMGFIRTQGQAGRAVKQFDARADSNLHHIFVRTVFRQWRNIQ